MADEKELTELSPMDRARRVAGNVMQYIRDNPRKGYGGTTGLSVKEAGLAGELLDNTAEAREFIKSPGLGTAAMAGLGLTGIPAKEIAGGAKAAARSLPTLTKKGDVATFAVPEGNIVVKEDSKWADGAHSIINFVVDESARGKGIGSRLLEEVVSTYPTKEISAQASSLASMKALYNKGFRPRGMEDASFEDIAQGFKGTGDSINMRLSPQSRR